MNRDVAGQRAVRGSAGLSGWRAYVPYAFSAVVLLVLIAYLCRDIDRYKQLLDLSIDLLLLLLLLRLLCFYANGLTNHAFYRGLGVPVSFNESLGLAAVSTAANQLPFAGGLVAKAVYLKQRHQLGYARFLSATLALYVCFVAANGAVGVAVLVYWSLVEGRMAPMLLILGFSVMAASILLLWWPAGIGRVPGRWGQRLIQLMDGWRLLSRNRLMTAKLVALQIMMTLLFAGRFWVAFHALSQDITLVQCVLFSAATILTRLVSIAPGGLGVRETIVASVASTLGFHFGVSVVAVSIDRLLATVVTAALGTVYTFVLSRNATGHSPEAEPTINHEK